MICMTCMKSILEIIPLYCVILVNQWKMKQSEDERPNVREETTTRRQQKEGEVDEVYKELAGFYANVAYTCIDLTVYTSRHMRLYTRLNIDKTASPLAGTNWKLNRNNWCGASKFHIPRNSYSYVPIRSYRWGTKVQAEMAVFILRRQATSHHAPFQRGDEEKLAISNKGIWHKCGMNILLPIHWPFVAWVWCCIFWYVVVWGEGGSICAFYCKVGRTFYRRSFVIIPTIPRKHSDGRRDHGRKKMLHSWKTTKSNTEPPSQP